MAYAGAGGETARQMETVLHFTKGKTNLHELFAQLAAVWKTAQAEQDIELHIANSLWPQEKHPFLNAFLDLLKKRYGARVTALDYEHDPEGARAAINGWVNQNTWQKISEIIGPGMIDCLTRMVLVNAIYFKGAWATPFPASRTQPQPFYLRPDRAVVVPFMNEQDEFSYAENNRLQLLVLPYGKKQLHMVLVLPRAKDGLARLEDSLNPTNLAGWITQARQMEVKVAIPKFKISSTTVLSEALQNLGMKDAFDGEQADFSGMDGKVHWLNLSAVLHRAFIEVNEHGTEAAAIAAIFGRWLGRLSVEPPEFRADRPFLFLIRESTTGSLLFMGRVSEPETG
jgi:serpin B